MTTLLVIGLIVLVVGMARTTGEFSMQSGDRSVAIPAGSELMSASADDGRLYLLLHHDDGRRSILVLDAASGQRLGEMAVITSP